MFGSLNCTPGLCARTSMSGTPSEPASLPSVSSSWAERASVGCLPLGGPARCRLPPLPPRALPPLPSVLQHGHVSPQALQALVYIMYTQTPQASALPSLPLAGQLKVYSHITFINRGWERWGV